MTIKYRESIFQEYKEITIAQFSDLHQTKFNFDNNPYTPVIELTNIDVENETLYYTNKGEQYN